MEGTADGRVVNVGFDMTHLAADLAALPIGPSPSTARSTARRPPPRQLATSLEELTSCRHADETLQLLLDLATEIVTGCDLADVMLLGAGRITTCVDTHPLALELDRLQDETAEGPCLPPSLDEEPVVYVRDLATDPRWPVFGPRAAVAGVRSVVSYGLYLGTGRTSRLGAMNLYGHRPDAFDAMAVQLGEVLATQVASVVATTIEMEGLRRALETRAVIGRAKGVVMDGYVVSASRALSLLRASSREHGLGLRDIAQHVTATGELP